MEIELKFQVPAHRRDALHRAVATVTARTTRLQAVYVDTPDRRLAAAGLVLRMRKEGRAWVQAVKGRGDDLMTRLEHEVPLAPQAAAPAPDPQRHAATPAGEALLAALGESYELQPVYRTDIRRVHRRLRSGGAWIEIAHDRGFLLAGDQRLPVDELEFELLGGPPESLVAVARRWATRFGLWWDVRTKSERGFRLALGMTGVPAVRALPVAWQQGMTPAAAVAAMLHASLVQLLPNAAEIASGSGRPEHVHQARVAIRRLRTALRLFDGWSADAEGARSLERRWQAPFAALGAVRDADVLAAHPGLPLVLPPPAVPVDASRVFVDPQFTALALETLERSLAPAPAAQAALREAAKSLLRRAWKQLVDDIPGFEQASPEARHRTRKRLKRLRYATEFLLPLLPAKAARRALRAQRQALDALGAYNDLLVAETRCRALDDQDPLVAYALGWLAAHRDLALQQAVRQLAPLADLPRFWR